MNTLALSLAFALSLPAFASHGPSTMRLVIMDRSTREPIAGALARIGESFTASSDSSGLVAAILPHGTYRVRVSATGYRSVESSIRHKKTRTRQILLRKGEGAGGDPNSRAESFNRDPNWDGSNNRNTAIEPREIRQDFGWSNTSNAGGRPGEAGGRITPAGEPAYYAMGVGPHSFEEELSASGKLSLGTDAGGNTLIGFFNSRTVNEWRNPNAIMLRVYGRGPKIHVQAEYATSKWRAGANPFIDGRGQVHLFPVAGPHTWSIRYVPQGNGRIIATFDDKTVTVDLEPGHKADGATFDRLGILNVVKSADGAGDLWIDDLSVNGVAEDFSRDPDWEGLRNRETYVSPEIRFRFNFGFSPTSHAGGGPGEAGGLFYRGDDNSPGTLAYYAAPLENLTWDKPFKASGRVVLKRGHTDSGVLFGFFHSEESMRPGGPRDGWIPENFSGVSVEGPSREGFFFYPCYSSDSEMEGRCAGGDSRPRIYPDSRPHAWTLEFNPEGNRLTATLDGQSASIEVRDDHRRIGARFNRFGFITTHVDGNGQELYIDDVTFTYRQP